MGEDSAADSFYYMMNDDGTFSRIEPVELAETEYITMEPMPETELPVVKLGQLELEMEMEISLKIPTVVTDGKFFRCGSRKRFVKKLMSFGVSRNEANRSAKQAQIQKLSYTRALVLGWYCGRWGFWMKQRSAGCGGFAM